MDSTVSVAAIQQMIGMLMNPTKESYIQATAQKNLILTDQKNAYILLQILLTQNLSDLDRSLILDLLFDFIKQHGSELAFYEIHKSLNEINPEYIQSSLIISKIASILAYIVKQIFITDNQYILTFLPNRGPMNPLECREFCECCTIFEENVPSLPRDENFRIQKFFQDGPLILYASFAISTLDVTPDLSTKLLLACLQFRTKNRAGPARFISMVKDQEHLMQELVQNDIYSKLKNILFSQDQESSVNAITIASTIAQSMLLAQSPELKNGMIDFISTILQNTEIFQDKAKVSAIAEMLSNSQVFSPELTEQGINFILQILENNFVLAAFLLQSCLKICIISNQVNGDVINQFGAVMEKFVLCGLSSFDANPEATYSAIFDDIIYTSSTIDDLLLKSQFTVQKDIISISDLIEKLSDEPLSIVGQYKLGFLIQIARSAVNNPVLMQKITNDTPPDATNQKINFLKPLVHSVFSAMMKTGPYIKEFNNYLKEQGANFAFELSMIQFISDCNKQYNNQFHQPIFNEIPYFSSDSEMIYRIFWRQWTDLVDDICSLDVQYIMKNQNFEQIFTHLINTDVPNHILTNYINYPPKYLIYSIVASIIKSKIELRQQFCDSLVENFRNCQDPSMAKRLFRILFCLFSLSLDKEDWSNLYTFFYDNFSELAVECASGPAAKTVFKFISKMVIKAPLTIPFSKRNPQTFRFYKFISHILFLISDNLLKDLPRLDATQIPTDLTPQSTETISLVEAHDMKRRHSDCITVSMASIGGNWHLAIRILMTLNSLMVSPFTNFGIISYYNDRSHLDLFRNMMEHMGVNPEDGPNMALLTIPRLVDEILNFIKCNFSCCASLVLEEPYLMLSIQFCHIGMLSNNIETISAACGAMIDMAENMPDVSALQPHVIMLFNILFNQPVMNSLDFLAKYYEKDPQFIFGFVENIAQNLPEHLSEPFMQLYTNYIQNNADGQISLSFGKFFDETIDMRIQLYTMEQFAQFFN